MTLRSRTTLIVGLASGIVLVASGVLLYSVLRNRLIAQFDATLVKEARFLADAVEMEDGELEMDFEDLSLHDYQDPSGPGFFQLQTKGGQVLYRSNSLQGRNLPSDCPSSKGETNRRQVRLGDVETRLVCLAFEPRRGDDQPKDVPPESADRLRTSDANSLVLLLARDSTPVDATLAIIRSNLLTVGAVALVSSLLILWLSIRRSLKPLRTTAETIAAIQPNDLSVRLPDHAIVGEMQPVIEKVNLLLDKVHKAMRREKQFSSNVAHELRTPLAGARAALEIALRSTRSTEEYIETIRDCCTSMAGLQRLVTALLALGRLEAGQSGNSPEPVDLEAMVRERWQELAAKAASRDLNVRWDTQPIVPIHTDRSALDLVVGNVLSNAVAHADCGGQVVIQIQPDPTGSGTRFCVANTGSRIPAHQAAACFDRLWRGDDARSTDGGHTGLGLALVKQAADLIGCSVDIETQLDGWFRICVRISDTGELRGR